jgi:uncharacterized membrane protein YheB (UPF0754 family)
MLLTPVDMKDNLIDPDVNQPAKKLLASAMKEGNSVGQELTKNAFALNVPDNLSNLGMQRRLTAEYADDLEPPSSSELIDLFLDEVQALDERPVQIIAVATMAVARPIRFDGSVGDLSGPVLEPV